MKDKGTALDLSELVDPEVADDALPIRLSGIVLKETPPPRAIENLVKLEKLGILNGDSLMSLIAQAPIDPVNLVGTLMQLMPDAWAFSAVDFAMVRVTARDSRGVCAALHVDLMNNIIKFLVRNRAGQLVTYKDYPVEPGPKTLEEVQALVQEAIQAAERETK